MMMLEIVTSTYISGVSEHSCFERLDDDIYHRPLSEIVKRNSRARWLIPGSRRTVRHLARSLHARIEEVAM